MIEDNILVKLIKKHGVENLQFKMKSRPIRNVLGLGYTTSSDKEVEVMCQVSEDRYQVNENYKITLAPFNSGFSKEHFYQSDLISLIRRGSVSIQDPNGNPIDLE